MMALMRFLHLLHLDAAYPNKTVPAVFRDCPDEFIVGKDEKYASCNITNDDTPCYLLKELHKAKEFRVYGFTVIPIVLSVLAMILNVTYLIIQLRIYRKEEERRVTVVKRNFGHFKSEAIKIVQIVLDKEINETHEQVALCVGLWGATLFYPESAPVHCSYRGCQKPLAVIIECSWLQVGDANMEHEYVPDRQQLRHVTHFFYQSGSNMMTTETKMRDVYEDHAPSYRIIVRWYKRFKVGDYTLKDEERSGRSSELNLSELRRVVETDPFQSTREMANTLGVHSSTIESGQKE
ncbi:hypothetical protein TELCIR_07536 [Teladorsagia circumcincta]|uniref:Mos1 transposase HTH domain-containing protein n=1 Tax=Teladorsagia circumcincta TaxID=45464 RepID=A0A2G9UK28_TELCI|nr:hypothetical protein TELCIR_07536 [Teladorsagia circumcincta]